MERMDSIDHSCSLICHLIDQEKSRGIPLDRIVIGGFGMGGNLAMHVGFSWPLELGSNQLAEPHLYSSDQEKFQFPQESSQKPDIQY
ncbi:unnamed protein product [Pocillopora meandrina]|uniref:Phospholipase/carboxylesterase/thioesterase domain-containing protein n=1 Tax=Pocillopora meandrina TaxID=46732 RepID=A0AAU9WE26_9CNID|nr:unnamed protein product [Pocillopora meandrina]